MAPLFGISARTWLLVITGGLGLSAHAQQDPQYTMYMWNPLTVNPAYAGSNDVLNTMAISRRQWVGLPGAPTTNALTIHSPLRERSLAVGGSVVDDRIGPARSTQLSFDVAYRIRTHKRTRLAFGLRGGANMMHMRMADVPGTDPNDPLFMSNYRSRITPNVGFGLYYWGKRGFLSLSLPKLLDSEHVANSDQGDLRLYRGAKHLFLMGGFVTRLNKDVMLRPSVLVKATPHAPPSVDVTLHSIFMDRFWLGASYRSGNELSALVSYQIGKQLRAGYAYDLSLSSVVSRHGGSHELMISYDLRFTHRFVRSPFYF